MLPPQLLQRFPEYPAKKQPDTRRSSPSSFSVRQANTSCSQYQKRNTCHNTRPYYNYRGHSRLPLFHGGEGGEVGERRVSGVPIDYEPVSTLLVPTSEYLHQRAHGGHRFGTLADEPVV